MPINSSIILLLLGVIVIILSIVLKRRSPDINPIDIRIDQRLNILRGRNTELQLLITDEEQSLAAKNTEIANTSQQIILLQSQLDALILQQSTQVVIPNPPPSIDPELILLLGLRDQLLSYLQTNIIPLTVYVNTDQLYIDVNAMITMYNNSTSLTLGQFLLIYSDAQVQQFRNDIAIILSSSSYQFDAFLLSIT